MQEDLVVARKLSDTVGECRAHGNLGSAYFSKGNYKVESHIQACNSKFWQGGAHRVNRRRGGGNTLLYTAINMTL